MIDNFGQATTASATARLSVRTALDDSILCLDWQHPSYQVWPSLVGPENLDPPGKPGWPLSPYPDGDYCIYRAEDFQFGTSAIRGSRRCACSAATCWAWSKPICMSLAESCAACGQADAADCSSDGARIWTA
ncbi:DUF2716 domain-containing protein [Micromonospora psammae]|uniref:DUF2716 domain-containing protein n=1 Tax=Micromonospora sp. CPCC 205556 TaxID=3122398 RepID=UPI002FF2FBC9